MIIRTCALTDKGRRLAVKLEKELEQYIWEHKEKETDTELWIRDSFSIGAPVVFIGAAGIAVRKIAPFVKDKLTDSSVIVTDEAGEFVIPILSGHVGGANELARKLADALKAQAVITTATDVEKLFSVDVFAINNGLRIVNREGIKKVSSKLLAGEKITIALPRQFDISEKKIPNCVEAFNYGDKFGGDAESKNNFESANDIEKERDVTVYIPGDDGASKQAFDKKALLALEAKAYVLGIGCKKDTDKDKLEEFICRILSENNIVLDDVCAMASIDLKQKEYSVNYFETKHRIPFFVYTAEELNAVEGEFAESDFVKSVTGVSNVCERAAMKLAGDGAELVVRKEAFEGMTVAVAKKKTWRIKWET